jgi:hypothetical protein
MPRSCGSVRRVRLPSVFTVNARTLPASRYSTEDLVGGGGTGVPLPPQAIRVAMHPKIKTDTSLMWHTPKLHVAEGASPVILRQEEPDANQMAFS